jgi:hypothetical protein
MSLNALVAVGPDDPLYAHAAGMVRVLLPEVEPLGATSVAEVAADTLAARLRDEVVGANATVVWVSLSGAATRKAG